jgi:predicted transcriptional regulator
MKMDRGQGKIQKAVIVALGERPKSVNELALEIYRGNQPNHNTGIRQALRQLAKTGVVQQSDVYTNEDGSRCWVLASAQMRNPQHSRHLRQVK